MTEYSLQHQMAQMEQNAGAAEALLKLLANRHRLMILCHLTNGERTVSQLMQDVGLSQSSLSQHLARMREQGLLEADKRGQSVHYRIGSMEARALLSTLHLIYCK